MTLTTWRWYNNNIPAQAIRPIIQPSLHPSILWKFIQPSPVAARLTHHGCARWSKLCDYDDNIQRFGGGGGRGENKSIHFTFYANQFNVKSSTNKKSTRIRPIDRLTNWPIHRPRMTNKVGTGRTLLQHFVKHSVPIVIKTITIISIMLVFSTVQVFEVWLAVKL